MPVELTLSGGAVVRVYAVSPFTLDAAEAKTTLPPMPMVDQTVTTDGGSHVESHIVDQESAAYKDFLIRWQTADEQRRKDRNEAALLHGLRDVAPPADDGWLELLRYEQIPLHEGPFGRKLDFIKHELMQTQGDIDAVLNAVGELAYAKSTSIKSLEDHFRSNNDDQRPVGEAARG